MTLKRRMHRFPLAGSNAGKDSRAGLNGASLRSAVKRMFQGLMRRAPMDKDGVARIAAKQIYILPTRIGMLYGTTVIVMLLGSLNYQNNIGLLFAFFMASVGLVAMHHCWYNLLGLAISMRSGPAVFDGDAALFEVTLSNERAGSRYDLRLSGGLDASTPVYLDAHDQRGISFAQPTSRRGLLWLKDIEIETRHPMHLFRAWCYARGQASVLVYPRPAVAAPPPVTNSGDTHRPAARTGDGADDYIGNREYRRGDSTRHLDWKAFARERGLVVKQFGGDDGVEVWIDWTALRTPDPEERIRLLTRQVLDADAANLRFGMRLPGIEIGLAGGPDQMQRCLRELALFNDGQTEPAPH